jgi:membrane protein YdbS with pleckstrin-like domain
MSFAKKFLAPFVLMGYIGSLTLLTAFALMSLPLTTKPDVIWWLLGAAVTNAICFVVTITWIHNKTAEVSTSDQ